MIVISEMPIIIKMDKIIIIFLLTFFSLFSYSWQAQTNLRVNEIILQNIYKSYSVNKSFAVDFTEFTKFYREFLGGEEGYFSSQTKNISECFHQGGKAEISKCLFEQIENKCLNANDLFELYSLPTNTSLSLKTLEELSVGILYSMRQPSCIGDKEADGHLDSNPTISAVWGYGILFVTIINLCSLVGIIVLPFMKMVIYNLLLIFMVALAVGTLAGSGLFFLIPEAFGLVQEGDTAYIWKSATIIGGIYLFYLTERIMKMIMQWRQSKKKERKDKNIYCSVRQRTPRKSESEYKDPTTIPNSSSSCTQMTFCLNDEPSEASMLDDDVTMDTNGIEKSSHVANGKLGCPGEGNKEIATVAWMIIFGDGLHNFIDGLSIGAAFTNSILSGVSVSLACICEELPHELGDFAILLNSGMSLRKALTYNFLSACMCYLGLIVGILLGESTSAHEWIFAVAGGMFLYISLVDMMPEMNSAAESEAAEKYGPIKIFLLQNFGLFVGFTIMLVMALYGKNITFE